MSRRSPAAPAATVAIAATVALVALGLAAPGAARADEVKLPNTKAALTVPSGWKPIEGRGLVASYRGDGLVLAVTRAQVTNVDAYRSKVRDAYTDEIERGIAASIPGYRRVSRKLAEQNGTPALDLEATRGDGATIVVRVLLFWTYALSLAIEVPPGASAKSARAIAASFAPPKPKP